LTDIGLAFGFTQELDIWFFGYWWFWLFPDIGLIDVLVPINF